MTEVSGENHRPLRIFVAGGSGVIGRALIPKLAEKGHAVTAMTRTPARSDLIRRLGADPVACDVFDREDLRRVVAGAKPDVVVNQLTELPKGGLHPKKLAEVYAKNDRVRREGTDNLLAAASAAGATRYIGQSVAFFYQPVGARVKNESDQLWLDGPTPFGEAARALKHSEDVVLNASDIEGVVLRYGTFYGLDTWFSPEGEIAEQMKAGKYPIIGSGTGTMSFTHIDDAAEACVAFVESGEPGIYNIVDDEPATANEWMPIFARAVGARQPRRVPVWLAKVLAGKALVEWSTTCRGAWNKKVKDALGWTPRHATWRKGFSEMAALGGSLTEVA